MSSWKFAGFKLGVPQAPAESADPATAEDEDVEKVQLVTLELTPEDTMRLVFSQNEGIVWLGLIRPGDEVADAKPVGLAEVVGR